MTVLSQFRDASGHILFHRRRGRQQHGKLAPFAGAAFDQEAALMTIEDVLDDGETQPRTPPLAAAPGVYPVKPLGKARDRLAWNALAVVADFRRNHRLGAPAKHGRLRRD